MSESDALPQQPAESLPAHGPVHAGEWAELSDSPHESGRVRLAPPSGDDVITQLQRASAHDLLASSCVTLSAAHQTVTAEPSPRPSVPLAA